MKYRHRPAHCETRPIVRNYDEFTVSAQEAAWLVAAHAVLGLPQVAQVVSRHFAIDTRSWNNKCVPDRRRAIDVDIIKAGSLLRRRRWMLSRRSFFAASLLGIQATVARLAASADVAARPSEILLLRHAEKTEPKGDLHLSERGRARAQALPRLFTSRFARPDFLFAARQSKFSNHAYETIEPLARAFGRPIDDHLPDGEYAALATLLLSDPRYRGAHVLVCWHHESLPLLATALGARGVPLKWQDKVYDEIWRLRYAEERPTFERLPQKLLPGDRSGPV